MHTCIYTQCTHAYTHTQVLTGIAARRSKTKAELMVIIWTLLSGHFLLYCPPSTSVLSPYLCPFFCHSECLLLTNRAVGSSRLRGSGKTKGKLCAVQQQPVMTKASTQLCGRVLQGPRSWAESYLQQTHRGYYSSSPLLFPRSLSVLGQHTTDQESQPQALASAS